MIVDEQELGVLRKHVLDIVFGSACVGGSAETWHRVGLLDKEDGMQEFLDEVEGSVDYEDGGGKNVNGIYVEIGG